MISTHGRTSTLQQGERTNEDGKQVRNHILLSIPDEEFLLLRPHLRLLNLLHHRSLHEPNEKLNFIYFPNGALVSLVVTTREGKTVEVGVVGNEGLVGMPATVGLNRSPHRAVVQIGGPGFQIRADTLRQLLPSTPQLQLAANACLVGC